MSDDFVASPPHDLYAILQGVQEPATTAELVEAACTACATNNDIETLRRLPERQWTQISEAVAAATSGWQPGAPDT